MRLDRISDMLTTHEKRGRDLDKANERIAALTAERDALRKALEPFANAANRFGILVRADASILHATELTVGDLNRARAVLAQKEPGA